MKLINAGKPTTTDDAYRTGDKLYDECVFSYLLRESLEIDAKHSAESDKCHQMSSSTENQTKRKLVNSLR